ncbi:MAG: DUF3536 domain-containing protein [Deltaproteobacteria bacterium]|nr:DUF3536 domain-containing protein [Deltaproteobacteria bacterium]
MPKDEDPTIYACIHGHFYQPPRENPWLEDIEREESAAPFHDWNERIADECYQPNAAARILDGQGRVVDLINNYRHLSFNFGPTLLRWMERRRPRAYAEILDADKRAVEERGHGNAVAQVYNHVILPLANRRDKETQVRWGMRDFEHRFGRKPEGMWLAETACDKETLEVLADNGIQFTVLSPHQAKRWRFLDGSGWTPSTNGDIPTGRAYLYQQHRGRPLHLFFYDAAIAKGIAFDGMLADAHHLVGAVEGAFAKRNAAPGGPKEGEPWLVHTATDGESYGHHFKFGDMALASAFAKLRADKRVCLTGYAQFLARSPVRAEADILDVSAWSCAHGVGRWSRDCGCNVGGGPGWNQRWREPLRAALDGARDTLAAHYEREMGKLARDPWATRDAYIDVVLDPSRTDELVADRAKKKLSAEERVTFFRLLEMQRCALLMYTSCGWFFDDIGGGESVILMKYAARALALGIATGGATGVDAEAALMETLKGARSNVPGPKGEPVTGADIYLQRAKVAAITPDNVAVSHALQALAEGPRRSSRLYAYDVTLKDETAFKKGRVPCVFGRVTITDTRTDEAADTVYALAHFGGLDFRCCTAQFASDADLQARLERVRAAAVEGSTPAMVRALDEAFGHRSFSLRDAFKDLRQQAARALGAEKIGLLEALGDELLESHRALLLALRDLDVPLPLHVETLASHVLSRRADALVAELVTPVDDDDADFTWRALSSQLRGVVEETSALGLTLGVARSGELLGDALVAALDRLREEPGDAEAAVARRLVDAIAVLGIQPRQWQVQTSAYALAKGAREVPALGDALRKHRDLLEALDALCHTRFAALALP